MTDRQDHRVLIVDDDSDMREGLAFLLQHQGHQVVTAGNGHEALQVLGTLTAPPCLIILDLMMPEMDGWTLRRRLLDQPALAEVPVVLVSGVADLDRSARALQAVDYLPKPIDFQRLYQVVGAHC